jgi:DNA-binding Lrp family transcriptional regulator
MITSTMNPTTIFARVQPSMRNQVAEQLKKIQGITYFSPLAGRFDFAIELKAGDQKQVYELVNKMRSISGVTSTRTYTPFEGFANGKNIQATDSLALVLVKVNEQAQAQKVLQSMEQQAQVRNAYVVPGEFDILATVYGKNNEEILSQVSKIADVQGVRTSETLLAYKPIWA